MNNMQPPNAAMEFSEDIIAAASCGILVYEETGQCVLANAAAAEIVGTTIESLRQQNFRELKSWSESGMLALAETVLATGEKHKQEFHLQSSFGKEMWIACKFSQFVRGGRRYLLLVTVNNTKRAEAEQATAKARNFLAQIINAVGDPIFVKDRNHRMLMLNDACCQLNRRRPEEMIGKTVREYFPAADAENMLANDEHVFLTGQENINEDRVTDSEGGVHTVVTKKTRYIDADGSMFLVGVVRDLTRYKQMEMALQESQALYQSLLRNLPCDVFRKDAAGRYVFVNPRFCEHNGLTPEQILGKTPAELTEYLRGENVNLTTDELSLKIVAERELLGAQGSDNHRHIMATGETITVDEVFTAKNGAKKYFQVIKSPVTDETGKIIGTQGIQFDITVRKQAELAVRESEDRYRMLFNSGQDAMYVHEPSDASGRAGRFVEVNEVACQLLGYAREELLQLTPDDIAATDAGEDIRAVRAKLKAEGHAIWEAAHIAKNGRRIPVEVHAHLFELNGKPMVLGDVRDITQRLQAQDELRKLSRAVDQSPVSIIITDSQARIEYVNPKFVEMTGYTLAEVAGKPPLFMHSGEAVFGHESVHKKLWATITAGREWKGEFQNKRKCGAAFWESVSISPIKAANGAITHFVILKEDITKHKQLEGEFRQAQKMEAFGSLSAGVAHDFNNILTAILCNVELIQGDSDLNANQQEALGEIKTAGERAANLTRQLLLFSRQKPMQTKLVQVNDVVENMGKMLRRLIGEHIQLKTQYCAGDTPVIADPSMLEQVLLNLTVNSRDAMADGGELTIATETMTVTEATGRRRCGHFVRFSVSDTGSGISPEDMEHIFEPFFTTKEVGKGTGLGLATVFGIVEQHKGWIEVETTVGSGTTFHIFLPRHEVAADTDFIQKPKSQVQGGTETILLVEDEPALRKLARTVLTRLGYKVYEASSALAAIEVWQEHQAEIALLFTDMVMPGKITGLELSKRLVKAKPGLKVVYTSGYTDEMLKEGSELRHSPNFLEKPYGTEVLSRKIRAALDN